MRDIVKNQVTAFTKALSQNFFPLALKAKGSDNTPKDILMTFGEKLATLNKHVLEHDKDLSDLCMNSGSEDNPLRETYQLQKIVSFGCSPFMFNYDEEDRVKGFFVKIGVTKRNYCKATIKQLTEQYYNHCIRTEEEMSMNKARKYVIQRVSEENNPDKVPILTKFNTVSFYVDCHNATVWVPVSHRKGGILRYFAFLVKHLLEFYKEEHPTKGEAMVELIEDITQIIGFGHSPFTQHCQRTGDAIGAYHLTDLVRYFAEHEDETAEVSPTTSADMSVEDSSSAKIKFKNTIDLFVEDTSSDGYFDSLIRFADEKGLQLDGLDVVGEVFLHPEHINFLNDEIKFDDELEAELFKQPIAIDYNTKAQNANLVVKMKPGSAQLKLIIDYTITALTEHFWDNTLSPVNKEKALLERMSYLTNILHNSFQLFVKVYKDANKAPENFGEKVAESNKKFSDTASDEKQAA